MLNEIFAEAKHQDKPEVAIALPGQLVSRCLCQHETRTALFLVYWFKPQAASELAKLRRELAKQARQASVDDLLVRSYVPDIRLSDNQ